MAETASPRNSTTSFAKEIQLDTYRQSKLDQVKSLRESYAATQTKRAEAKQAMAAREVQKPNPEPVPHLRPPDSAERRAVDAKVHHDELAQARAAAQEKAEALRKEFASRQQQSPTRANGRSR